MMNAFSSVFLYYFSIELKLKKFFFSTFHTMYHIRKTNVFITAKTENFTRLEREESSVFCLTYVK